MARVRGILAQGAALTLLMVALAAAPVRGDDAGDSCTVTKSEDYSFGKFVKEVDEVNNVVQDVCKACKYIEAAAEEVGAACTAMKAITGLLDVIRDLDEPTITISLQCFVSDTNCDGPVECDKWGYPDQTFTELASMYTAKYPNLQKTSEGPRYDSVGSTDWTTDLPCSNSHWYAGWYTDGSDDEAAVKAAIVKHAKTKAAEANDVDTDHVKLKIQGGLGKKVPTKVTDWFKWTSTTGTLMYPTTRNLAGARLVVCEPFVAATTNAALPAMPSSFNAAGIMCTAAVILVASQLF